MGINLTWKATCLLKNTLEVGNSSCSWIGRLDSIKMPLISKVVYRFTKKIPMAFFMEMEKNPSYMKVQTALTAKEF
jgi:hypothetical protein